MISLNDSTSYLAHLFELMCFGSSQLFSKVELGKKTRKKCWTPPKLPQALVLRYSQFSCSYPDANVLPPGHVSHLCNNPLFFTKIKLTCTVFSLISPLLSAPAWSQSSDSCLFSLSQYCYCVTSQSFRLWRTILYSLSVEVRGTI